jgi:magnesium chelatase subunit D
MILISDGRANVPLGDASVKEELLGIAEDARSAGIHIVVLDTESAGRSFVKMQLGYCKDIAEHAGGRYYSVEDLSSGTVRNIVANEQEMLVDIHSMWC